PDGFFLMVEGGRIDHAGHSNDQVKNALETIAFDQAVGFAHSFAKTQGETLVIVTADHETGGLSVTSENQSSMLPAAGMAAEANRTLRMERANKVTVAWSTTGHTSADVPFFGYGSEFSSYANRSIIDNTEIFHLMNSSLETTALPSSSESESEENN
ncbi:MAG: alkaline phosphatase, partial [Candidatus Hodarchaeales archaeon]